MAKAPLYVKTDVEGRKLRAPTGLDTQVVLAVNDECHRLDEQFNNLGAASLLL